ncbi:unnamed protein product, partial [Timema podura]|nr:unnamed protein product [Timema podura]
DCQTILQGSPNSSANVVGFVTPPPLPQQGPSAPFTQGHGVSLSYNIPPGSESTAASPGQVKHLNTNILQDDSLPPPYSSFSPNLNMPNKKMGGELKAFKLNLLTELSASQWDLIAKVVNILQIFDKATFAVSTSSVSASEIIPIINSTLVEWKKLNSEALVRGMKNDLVASLKPRYGYQEVEKQDLFKCNHA